MGGESKLARAFVVDDLLKSAKGAARTPKLGEDLTAPRSILREFLRSAQRGCACIWKQTIAARCIVRDVY